MSNVFAAPVFFICFRECLETTIIVSVLLSFLKQTIGPEKDPVIYRKLVKQVWWGIAAGCLICLCIGAAFIGVFYTVGADYFAKTEDVWEGAFALIASIIISIMGAALLRVTKLQEKWRVKLAKTIETKGKGIARGSVKKWSEKYAMFLLPFVTVLREGLEAVVFIGGVSLGLPATSFPLAIVTGFSAGILIGFLIYKGGNFAPLQVFLVISTCFLYLVAAGLFARAIWYFENYKWASLTGGDAAETGSGPGSYDIRNSVWHVNCCNPLVNGGGGWGIFNSLLGWTNSATYGTVIGYNMYWIAISTSFYAMMFNEKHGRWPFMKAKVFAEEEEGDDSNRDAVVEGTGEKTDNEQSLGVQESNSSSSETGSGTKP